MKKAVKTIILFILFNALLFTTLFSLNIVMRNKEYEGSQDLFKDWNPEHADIVFIGNSHQFCTINPDILYDEYGIESFMLASSGQTVPMSYYAAMEAIELKHPDTIVFEVSYVANDFRTLKGMDHCFFDGFPRCQARKLALADLVEKEDRIYYLLPLGMFHSRWKELSKVDFEGFPLSARGGFYDDTVEYNIDIELEKRDVTEAMPAEMQKYIDLMIDLCEKENVNLIMYAAPFNSLYVGEEYGIEDVKWRQSIFNYTEQYVEARGITFHNLFYEIPAMNIDNATDWRDTQHYNASGQAKVTRYMAEMGYFDSKDDKRHKQEHEVFCE